MTSDEKNTLIQDLNNRLFYGVILNCCDMVGEVLTSITKEGLINNDYDLEEVKPCLFPLSSMTEEQKEELNEKFNVQLIGNNIYIHYHSQGYWDTDLEVELQDWLWLINWCYKNHFDINKLIEKGLAIDASKLNIYGK